MKCQQRTLIALSGLVWIGVGIFLLTLGIKLLTLSLHPQILVHEDPRFSIVSFFSKIIYSKENSVIAILAIALIIGYVKGKTVLKKSVKKQIDRIHSKPNPAPLTSIYSPGSYLLIGAMMGLGFLMRILPISPDTRGAVDVAIGAALINGSILYFRQAAAEFFPHKNKT